MKGRKKERKGGGGQVWARERRERDANHIGEEKRGERGERDREGETVNYRWPGRKTITGSRPMQGWEALL